MKILNKDFIINMLEARLLDFYYEYTPQSQYNSRFLDYLYRYIRDNIYTGQHYELLQKLNSLSTNAETKDLFKNTTFDEDIDKQTYVITDDTGITYEMYNAIQNIIKDYYNYKYVVLSNNRIEVKIGFGWLPSNTISWLNLFNDDSIIDYYIDGVTLKKNTKDNNGRPNSGYVCFRFSSLKEYDTIMFLVNKSEVNNTNGEKITFATLLTELEGSKGATLNRIVEFDLGDNAFYELGRYAQNYLTAEKSDLIIQIPYDYVIDDYFYLYDVTNIVRINNKNNEENLNSIDNYFVNFNNDNFNSMFIKYNLQDKESIEDNITKEAEQFNLSLLQYLLGDFIWKTADSKLIAYAQNLINAVLDSNLTSNGVWSEELSNLITNYKKQKDTLYIDDVLDKKTEEYLLNDFIKINPDVDSNLVLFNEW